MSVTPKYWNGQRSFRSTASGRRISAVTWTAAAVGFAGLKAYSGSDAEVKRVWVEPGYRRNHIAEEMMDRIEEKAKARGFARTILQTRPVMQDAVGLYIGRGYRQIENYPPYDRLDGAVCFAKDLK